MHEDGDKVNVHTIRYYYHKRMYDNIDTLIFLSIEIEHHIRKFIILMHSVQLTNQLDLLSWHMKFELKQVFFLFHDLHFIYYLSYFLTLSHFIVLANT